MSEMSRPSLPPPASQHDQHDQHDQLLVAQLVAGDALDESQLALARAWLASCPACGSLAADLRLLPAVVAHEPVPRRRRDFRLSPQQAERLSGNAITRAFRRLSLPQARAFAPAAGAVMSIGLIFVVAGYVWPDGGSVAVEQDAAAAPTASMVVPPPAEAFHGVPSPGADELARYAAEASPAADDLEHQSGDTAGAAEAGLAADSVAPRERVQAEADGAQPDSLSQRTAADPESIHEQATSETTASALTEMAMIAPASPAPAPSAVAVAKAGSDDALAADAAEGTLAPSGGADDLGSLLMVIGAALALGGGSLLLLGLLVRRSSDPLLR